MDGAWPSSAFVVLNGAVEVCDLTGTPGEEWASIECSIKKAYGCGEIGQMVIEGLTLYVRRLDHLDLSSYLSIRLSDVALRCIEKELGAPSGRVEAESIVQVANQQLLVLSVVFRRRYHGRIMFYLVYDNTDVSLRMIPWIPHDLEATYTLAPVPVRIADGQGRELVLMAREYLPLHIDRGRLCMFNLASPHSTDYTNPWNIKVHRFTNLSVPFSADVTFSCGGKIFWADLVHGLAYSDLRTGVSVVETDFIKLPCGLDKVPARAAMKRTVGCVKGSIRFVCISHSVDTGDEVLKIWTLDLVHRRWKEEKDSHCPWKELWKEIGFMNLQLRDVEPQFPILMPDGALCLLLCDMRKPSTSVLAKEEYICSFDMPSKKPRWYGRVWNYSVAGPVILPYNLFTKCFPPPPQRELPATGKRELPSISWQVSKRSSAIAQVVPRLQCTTKYELCNL